MNLSKTDTTKLLKLLEEAAFLIETHCVKPCQQDKGRQLKLIRKKIIRKSKNQNV